MTKKDYLLYLVTDSRFENLRPMYEQIEEAIRNGVTMIQFRDKNLGDDEFLNMAIKLRGLTKQYNISLVINDRVDIAIKCGADGVHLGRRDMSIVDARKRLGSDVFIGSSVATLEEALAAQKDGADYLGIGAVFNTSTKNNTREVSIGHLREICKKIDIPAVAIGGINQSNIEKLQGSGISGVALVSAILNQSDVASATRNMKKEIEKL